MPPLPRARLVGLDRAEQAVLGGIVPGWGPNGVGGTAIRVQAEEKQPLEESMSRHLADHRTRTSGGRLKHFLRLARTPRETWQRPRGTSGSTRLVQFLRIERGRTA